MEIKYQRWLGNPTEPLKQIFLLQRDSKALGNCQCEELNVKVILGGPESTANSHLCHHLKRHHPLAEEDAVVSSGCSPIPSVPNTLLPQTV